MSLTMAFTMALKSINSSKMRSFLTMLGIIIGVSAVIILISIVQGSTKQMTERLEAMGTNLISVNIIGRGSTRTVKMADAEQFVEKNSELFNGVSPSVSGNNITVKYGNKNLTTNLEGTNEFYGTVRNTKVQLGRFISELDVELRNKVVLIGEYNMTELFGTTSPIGESIKLNGELYTVVGVLERKSNASQGSTDDRLIIPYTTATRLLRNAAVRQFSFMAASPDTMTQAMNTLETWLFRVFNSTNSYRIMNQADQLEMVNQNIATMTMMMGGIAAISLLVGGIGIMNIMLVSVTERTREIGIRKSIGARRRSILSQFLIEAIVVSCMGGLMGVLIGIGGSYAAGRINSIDATPSVVTMAGSFAFALVIGVFFGWYPANKASKLNPIEALRFE